VPNNLDPEPILVNLFPQQLIIVITNILPTIDSPTFVDPMGEFFQVLELKFVVKCSKFFLKLATFFWQKDEILKMLYMRLLKLEEDT
jgi:hypothetical protein